MVSFTPRPLYPRERAPGTHWIGGWVNPRVGLDDVEKRNFLTLPGLELRPLGRPARSQLPYRLRYLGSDIATPNVNINKATATARYQSAQYCGASAESRNDLVARDVRHYVMTQQTVRPMGSTAGNGALWGSAPIMTSCKRCFLLSPSRVTLKPVSPNREQWVRSEQLGGRPVRGHRRRWPLVGAEEPPLL
jgi:hypothetical protein